MVRLRSGARRVHDDDDDVVLLQDGAFTPSPRGDASTSQPAKKRCQTDVTDSKSPKKRRRRKREELCQLNLDVLFLIGEYIHPMDLLNLARTCKSLRELLMDKSSEFVWKTARRQVVGLPDCPVDLTEPEYANLVFCARCHSCGKPAKTVLWKMRRRYCPNCKRERVCELSSCDKIIRKYDVLPSEFLSIDTEVSRWVDKDQMESFLDDYRQSANKKQFLHERQEKNHAVYRHARNCERWQQNKAIERRDELAMRRDKREKSIFDKLKEHGYGPEIAYFGYARVRDSHKAVFRTSKPLTNNEWDRMWPEWCKIMDDSRLCRINKTVYQPRRNILASEYNTYVTHPTPDGPTFDLLPHVVDLACFTPFRNIIRAPEETQMNDGKVFASAFTKLPDLIDGWKKKLDTELAELVEIPLHLSLENASEGQVKISSCTGHVGAPKTGLDKLQLACAVFSVGRAGPFNHLNVFFVSMYDRDFPWSEYELERTGSIRDRFRIEFLEDAPYIIRTCGLDPNVATVDDMDHRNARMMCVNTTCNRNIVMDWRAAMWHATIHTMSTLPPLSEMPRWQLVGDEHISAIQAIEQTVEKELSFDYVHCLLCRPRVGDASYCDSTIIYHIVYCHKMEEDQIKRGVHYRHVSMCSSLPQVVMVEGEEVTFRRT